MLIISIVILPIFAVAINNVGVTTVSVGSLYANYDLSKKYNNITPTRFSILQYNLVWYYIHLNFFHIQFIIQT